MLNKDFIRFVEQRLAHETEEAHRLARAPERVGVTSALMACCIARAQAQAIEALSEIYVQSAAIANYKRNP